MQKIKLLILVFTIISKTIIAQQPNKFENPLKKGWTVYFGADSSLSIRTIGLVQLQARYMQLNPNSISPTGEIKNSTIDFAIARVCIGNFLTYKRLNLFYLFGNNFQSIATAKQGNFYTYEVYASYNLIPRNLSIGLGQTLYNGISRASSFNISQFITVENLPSALPTLGKSDNIARQFQLFAIGKINKLEYRTALVRPMLQVGTGTSNLPDLSIKAPINTSIEFPSDQFGAEGYFCWQFFDEEDIRYSSKSFSYLGNKKIFNVGAGFEYQPRATAFLNENRDTIFNKTLTISADFFADIPLKSGAVITAYGAFYNYDYGKNYLKTGGNMNYFTSGTSPQGAGNSEYTIGTGNAFCFQLAYLFAKPITKDFHKLQIYTYFYYKDFKALNQKSWQPGCGLNYYILGHNAKIGIQYYLRNVYDKDLFISSSKNNIIMQLQVSF